MFVEGGMLIRLKKCSLASKLKEQLVPEAWKEFFFFWGGGEPSKVLQAVLACKTIYATIYITNYVSQFTVETYCFADGRCLFKQPQSVIYHWNQYDEEI